MATNMRITDPQWPALREAARRILRLKEIQIIVPTKYHLITNEMIRGLGDKQPSRLIFPQIIEGPKITVEMLVMEEQLNGVIMQISHNEPDSDILWIKGDNDLWLDVLDACDELLSAGYPGCLGCGGPNSEQKWDELNQRNSTRNVSRNDP